MTKDIEIYEKDNNEIDINRMAWLSLSEESRNAYKSDYNLFFNHINKDVSEISPIDILEYVEFLNENGYKNSTVNRKLASLSKMFKVLVSSGKIKINPVDALKEFKNLNATLVREIHVSLDIEDIRKATSTKENDTIIEKQISFIIKVLSMTGLRVTEFLNIKFSDVQDFDDNTYSIRITGKGNKERTIYIQKTVLDESESLWPKMFGNSYIFYSRKKTKYSRKYLWLAIKRRFEETTGKEGIHPHSLRHFFATYKISVEKQDIKAVSLFLGHSDVSITLGMYVDTCLTPETAKIDI